jgi:hypothetical protein
MMMIETFAAGLPAEHCHAPTTTAVNIDAS